MFSTVVGAGKVWQRAFGVRVALTISPDSEMRTMAVSDSLTVALVMLEAVAVAVDGSVGEFFAKTDANRLDAWWRTLAELAAEMRSQAFGSHFAPGK